LEEKKRKEDYKYLISQGVETEYGFVYLGGKPIIKKHPGSRIILGRNITLLSDSEYNCAGINHPVILATLSNNAIIEIKDGAGLSGTSVVSQSSIVIGEKVTIGVNVNIYDTDFHPVDSILRENQNESGLKNVNTSPIVLERNVWIGANSTILKGVVIGENAIVGVNSLVNKSIESNVLAAGVPTKIIRKNQI